ncbi:UDP-N-acetylglucosamine transporter yea4 [Sphaceloma murrayae]|uniref:UDP-N-acetylglucosamine transporter yea4 n=1 Tax=Sphaceloma murrayae TaxID=2082308 RepID=A0A2K1QTX3_9PEZI|nr:UDP-N-acetylglucosamine transporter yea4 [Sphaceloma murrayae]
MIEVFGPLSVITLIFGGCCSNVYALEEILKQEPDSGLLITFLQFVLASALSAPTQLSSPSPNRSSGKPPVPFQRWAVIASMFYAVNMLNNWAFAFSISVPVHIILRSFGSVWTMAAGSIRGKRYSTLQIFSVALLTFGVIASAWADAESKGKNLSTSAPTSMGSFVSGLSLLLTAQILSAYMGIYVQDTYALFTTTWQENLFWSHFLSLPLFLPVASVLRRQYASLAATPPISTAVLSLAAFPTIGPAKPLLKLAEMTKTVPSGIFFLAVNAITQLACISGVNLLSSRSSAVTVTIVLNVRKLISFMFSTWLFGHELSGRMMVGAGLVFGSGALYGWETSWRIPRAKKAEANGIRKEKR